MASNFGDEDMSCSVCFEPYTEIGEHIPRILPCYHTLCENCIRQLILRKKLECPECRTNHEAKHGPTTFKQNKYIVTNIRRETTMKEAVSLEKFSNIKEVSGNLKMMICEKHGKELGLYCKEVKCQLTICQKCLIKNHVGHDVVDLEEEREELYKKVSEKASFLRKDLETAKGKFLSASVEFEKDVDTSLKRLEAQKEEFNLIFDKLEREIKDDIRNVSVSIRNDLSTIEEYFVLLSSLEENMNVFTGKETARNLDNMNDIETKVNRYLSKRRRYNYRKFEASEPRIVESFMRSLKAKEIVVRPEGGKNVKSKFLSAIQDHLTWGCF